jgi:Orsellinic acid/F9775 biosynthesis cluster protein D
MNPTLSQYFIYNVEYKILICREHQCGVTPNYVERHLRNEHRNIPLTTRQDILSSIHSLTLCIPEDIIGFTSVMSPVHGLEVVDGYKCQALECAFLAGTVESIKHHCRKHDRSLFEDGNSHYGHVKLQTFFKRPLLQ